MPAIGAQGLRRASFCLILHSPLSYGPSRADSGARTRDLFLTKEVLFQLSYDGTTIQTGEITPFGTRTCGGRID